MQVRFFGPVPPPHNPVRESSTFEIRPTLRAPVASARLPAALTPFLEAQPVVVMRHVNKLDNTAPRLARALLAKVLVAVLIYRTTVAGEVRAERSVALPKALWGILWKLSLNISIAQ